MTDNFIGIVGGMGPFTGVDLVDKIHRESIAVKDQDHLPTVLASYPGRIPDRGRFVLGQSDANPAEAIAEVIIFLDRAGAVVAGIPCVTAHCTPIMAEVQKRIQSSGVSLRLLGLIDETVSAIREAAPETRRVGALSTTASHRQQVFRPALEEAGYEVIVQDPSIQGELVTPAIFDPVFGIKSRPLPVSNEARAHVVAAIRHLRERGAEAVILGCTELPLAVAETYLDEVLIVDPTRALARGLIRTFAPEALRPLRSSRTLESAS